MATLRTSSPSYENKYYKHTSYGGVNECKLVRPRKCARKFLYR